MLYPIIEGADDNSSRVKKNIADKYWQWFWHIEGKLETLELGVEGSSIRGSERAVLIETILAGTKRPNILEVGIGYGQNLAILSTVLPQQNLFGIDIDAERVTATQEYFKEHGLTNIEIKVADAQSLPYEDNVFDVVFSSAVFLYLSSEEAKQALKEMLRVSSSKKIVLLEQHLTSIEEVKLKVGVVEGDYYIRDYINLASSIDPTLNVRELNIPNPRWAVENWKETSRVIVIEEGV